MNMVATSIRCTLCTSKQTKSFGSGCDGAPLCSQKMSIRTMEELLDKHQDHPAIKAIYFPHELNRVDTLLRGM